MKSSEGWSFCPYQGEGIRLAYFLGWRVFLESLQKSLQTTLWFPGCYKSVRFYKCTLRWLLSWAVSAQYVCAFTWFSLNSPSVSKLTSFKIVCMWQGCAFCLSSMQSSIQNVHDRSLPLPSVVFGLGSVLLCASMHLSEGVFFFFFPFSKMVWKPLSVLWWEGASVPILHLLPVSLLLDSSWFPRQPPVAVATRPAAVQAQPLPLPFPPKTHISNGTEESAQ